MTTPRIIITRPLQQAQRWVHDLCMRGWQAQALPLLTTAPLTDSHAQAALARARSNLMHARYQAAMFVSGNAVKYFFDRTNAQSLISEDLVAMLKSGMTTTRAWVTGPGTAAALEQVGWLRAFIDAPASDALELDSEALWVQVQPQVKTGYQVLLVRGGDHQGNPEGRPWLANQLANAGALTHSVIAYKRAAPEWDSQEQKLAQSALVDGSVWLISSSQAAINLATLAKTLIPTVDLGQTRALATHPRIAEIARKCGFGLVVQTRPELEAVIESIKSLV
jgi:uroporphyrinogen-III synthase